MNYVGSITIDEEFLEKANIREWEKVEILDIIPPRDVSESMEKQIKAERDKRAAILNAEATKQNEKGA